ncbi:hypothetical protein PAXRUDRAFT_797043, partial [Paxillus rubicundulus Ve08.2h10]
MVLLIDRCSFCGQSGHPVQLTKEGNKWMYQPLSVCPLAITFSLGAAAKSTKNSPLTNTPVHCSICPPSTGDCAVIWKYNVMYHLGMVHSEQNPAQPLPDNLVKAMNI